MIKHRQKKPRHNGRNNPRHKLWTLEVLQRDNNVCLNCSTRLRVYPRYILSIKDFPILAYDLSNGISLCSECYYELLSDDYVKMCRLLILKQKCDNNQKEKI